VIPLKATEIANIVSGQLLNGSSQSLVENVSTDSRTTRRGDLFIPLQGERYNGHQFLSEALRAGACGFLTKRWNEQMKIALGSAFNRETLVIKISETLKALQDLARYNRERLAVETIGITGSTGKTSTKDILASVLSESMEVAHTEKNYNNEIGVPLTLLQANEKTEAIIVEMAMRGLGQIRELAEIAQPTMGLITNVGKTHFELLGSEEAIAQAKMELIEAIPAQGVVILNNDDLWTEKFKVAAPCRIFTYGISHSSDLRADKIEVDSSARPSFELGHRDERILVKLPVPGRHNVYNALAAAAVALNLGLSLSEIKNGLEKCHLSEMRMEMFTTVDGVTILNDAYNANPASMRAALHTLQDIAGSSRKIAVLGDMLELGKLTEVSHFEIGEMVQALGIDLLVAIGEKSKRIVEGALGKGIDPKKVFSCTNTEEATEILSSRIKPGDVILVKASRGMQLEKVVNALSNL